MSAGDSRFDREEEAHRHFAADCFNRCWALIDRPARSPGETLEMLALAWASYWHWTRRPDFEGKRVSVAFWQLARVHALAGDAARAREFGERSLRASEGLQPFYEAYAHEALARAAAGGGDAIGRDRHLAEGRRLAATIEDAEEREAVLRDLESIP